MTLEYIHSLTNLEVRGTRKTEFEDGGWSYDTLDFTYKDVRCTLRQIVDYKEVIAELSKTHGAAVTAIATLETEQPRTEKEMDDLADSICDLLAFAKKNEVYWTGRTVYDGDQELSRYSTRTWGQSARLSLGMVDHRRRRDDGDRGIGRSCSSFSTGSWRDTKNNSEKRCGRPCSGSG